MINVSRDGKQIGQFSVSEINKSLASGTLLETDWAWYDGAADWVQITEVEGVTIEAENSLNKQDGEGLRERIRNFNVRPRTRTLIIIFGAIYLTLNGTFVFSGTSSREIIQLNISFIMFSAVIGVFIALIRVWEKFVEGRRKKEAEKLAAKIKEYNAAYHAYMTALDDLVREDAKENRIAALEKGRTVCAMYREFSEGEAHITAVDEQSLTNDIIARWGS